MQSTRKGTVTTYIDPLTRLSRVAPGEVDVDTSPRVAPPAGTVGAGAGRRVPESGGGQRRAAGIIGAARSSMAAKSRSSGGWGKQMA